MNSYCGLATFKARLEITGTADDAQLRLLIQAASRAVDNYCGRHFFAETATRYFDGAKEPLSIDDLLSVTTFKLDEDENGVYEATVAASDYYLWPYNGPKLFPKELVYIAPGGVYGAFANGVRKGVEIAGLWGYGTGLTATPYADSGATSAEELDASEVGVDVSSGSAFEVGQTILIESEQMYITGIATNTLTVRRAVNGTTAATHATGKAIYIFEYPEEVREAVFLVAGRLWRRKDTAFATVIASPELGGFEIYRGLDPDVKLLLGQFRKGNLQ